MNNQRGFIQGGLIIGIVLIALIAGAAALMANSDGRGIDTEKQKAAATVVVKRVADLIDEHQTKVAMGDATLGQGFATSLGADVNAWPKEAFVGGERGTAVNEGSVTYITGIDEKFCATLNSMLQVPGVPTPEDAPNDRISCVLAPEPK
jgi:hypothetical protein